jgi:hypothetical protein
MNITLSEVQAATKQSLLVHCSESIAIGFTSSSHLISNWRQLNNFIWQMPVYVMNEKEILRLISRRSNHDVTLNFSQI